MLGTEETANLTILFRIAYATGAKINRTVVTIQKEKKSGSR